MVLLAATNRPEILDPALLRAGRFDRQVLVDRPDKIGRAQILRVHMKKAKLADDVDPEKVAALTPGFTGGGSGQSGQRGDAACHPPQGGLGDA